jgi:multidrug efflux system membrane fusion protein
VAVLALTLALSAAACGRDKAESKSPAPRVPSVPVAVAAVEQKPVPVLIQAIGTVEAYSVVSVRAQVGGELVGVHFKEGQDVKKGDLLFTIDPRSFAAAVAQAQANLAKDQGAIQQARAMLQRDRSRVAQARAALERDKAQALNANTQERRYADLLQREFIAREQYDQLKTNADALQATLASDEADIRSAEDTVKADEAAVTSAEQTVRADEAILDNTKVQLSYTKIAAPIDGRTGSLMLHEGNVVRAGGNTDSTLVVINQVQPIYVSFTVPQQQLPAIKRYMAAGALDVKALPGGEQEPLGGAVTFIDNAVDQTTGTIRLKATFANGERRLWPGQFVNVALTLTIEPDAIVIPAQAVQSGQQGSSYVFVVKPDSTAEIRNVVVARTQGSDTIVSKGVRAGERVVTDGQPRLVNGTKVEVRTAERRGPAPGAPGPSAQGQSTPPPGASREGLPTPEAVAPGSPSAGAGSPGIPPPAATRREGARRPR